MMYPFRSRSRRRRCIVLTMICGTLLFGLVGQRKLFYQYMTPPSRVGLKQQSAGQISVIPTQGQSTFKPLTVNTVSKPLSSNTATKSVTVNKTVMIVAYHRTGSTLTGTTFQTYPGTFYVYEPFHMFDISHGKTMTLFNGTTVMVTEYNANELMVQTVEDWITCRLEHLYVETFLEYPHTEFSDSLAPFRDCVSAHLVKLLKNSTFTASSKEHLGINVRNMGELVRATKRLLENIYIRDEVLKNALQPCLQPIIQECKTAPLRAFKSIRVRMRHLEWYVQKYPELLLVNLVRDPRANIMSQKSVLRTSVDSLVLEYCVYMEDDMIVTEKLSKIFPSQIRLQYYEDFAESPMETAKKLYQFVNLPWTRQVKEFIWKSSLSGERQDCGYCVQKGDSKQTALAWRNRISVSLNYLVTKTCSYMMARAGYIPFDDISDVRNLSIPSRRKSAIQA